MLYSGLTSITFRNLTVNEIIEIVKKAGIDAIEWGGDIHVPHGDWKKAQEVGNMTREAGIEMPSYGSYYRVGCSEEDSGPFESILETAVALGTRIIRVWAGDKGSQEGSKEWRKRVLEESLRIGEIAEKEGVKVAFEYHDDTLTDTNESALKLLKEIEHPNIATYWQPPHFINEKERCRGLKQILPWLENIHIFYWTHQVKENQKIEQIRHPLEKASTSWKNYLEIAVQSGRDHFVMLEFVKGDRVEQFYKDAYILKQLLGYVNRELIK